MNQDELSQKNFDERVKKMVAQGLDLKAFQESN
jgi:hypothetical protein